MKSPRASSVSGTFLLSSVDRLGRAIDPLVLALRDKAPRQPAAKDLAQAEISLLFDEVMATYGKVTRQIVYRRLEGFSWKEIATECGLSTHAAEARYSRALAQARKFLQIPWSRH